MERRIHVTGAAGAVGSALVPLLAARGAAVSGHDRVSAPLPRADWLGPADCDATLVHLAADSRARGGGDPQAAAAPHLEMVRGLVARGWRGHLVFLSSAAVYGGGTAPFTEEEPPAPPNAYGAAKLAVETGLRRLAAAHGLALTVLRVANVYGSPQDLRRRRICGLLIGAALGGTPVTLYGDGSSRRDYLHLDDLCQALLLVLGREPPQRPEVLNLGSGHGTSLAELVALVEAVTGRQVPALRAPPQAESATTILDPALAAQRLGWRARTDLRDGLARLAAVLAPQIRGGG